jgi:hypothetical protein
VIEASRHVTKMMKAGKVLFKQAKGSTFMQGDAR